MTDEQLIEEIAAGEAETTPTREQHGKHCNCVTCELNETEASIRTRFAEIRG